MEARIPTRRGGRLAAFGEVSHMDHSRLGSPIWLKSSTFLGSLYGSSDLSGWIWKTLVMSSCEHAFGSVETLQEYLDWAPRQIDR